MKKYLQKISSKRGESFAELLVAVLVVVFGCLIIASLFATSLDLNRTAAEKDNAYYDSLTEMETNGTSLGDFQVDINDNGGSIPIETQRYGNEDYTSYSK